MRGIHRIIQEMGNRAIRIRQVINLSIHHAFEMRGWSEVKIDCVFSFIAFAAAALGLLFAYVYYL